jgi:hypothetical protein
MDVVSDKFMYFLRVRADGSIVLLDCPYKFSDDKHKLLLETLLERKCNQPYKLPAKTKSMSYIIKCPVL